MECTSITDTHVASSIADRLVSARRAPKYGPGVPVRVERNHGASLEALVAGNAEQEANREHLSEAAKLENGTSKSPDGSYFVVLRAHLDVLRGLPANLSQMTAASDVQSIIEASYKHERIKCPNPGCEKTFERKFSATACCKTYPCDNSAYNRVSWTRTI